MSQSPEKDIAEFIKNPPAKPTRCSSCNLPKADLINRAMRAFEKAKRTGETTQDWVALRLLLAKLYKYHVSVMSMRRHMKECLELT